MAETPVHQVADDADHAVPPHAPPEPSRGEVLARWLTRQPLVVPAIGLAAGITLDAARPVPALLAVTAFAAAAVLIVRTGSRDLLRYLGLLLAAIALGTVLHDLQLRRWPANHVVRYAGDDATRVRLTGMVIAAPRIRPTSTGRIVWFGQLPRTRLLVEAESLQSVDGPIDVTGTVMVHVREPVLRVDAGDRVELLGEIYRPRPPMNPGGKDWALTHRRAGVLVAMFVDQADNVVVRSEGESSRHHLARLRRQARGAMLDHTFDSDVPGAQLLSALVLGQRSAVSPEITEAFVRTGTVHYLSVSGAIAPHIL